MSVLDDISTNLQAGQAQKVKELVQQAVDQKVPVADILNKGLLAAMSVVGAKFKRNEVYVPEVLIAARAMSWGMEVLQPLLELAGVQPVGKVVIGTVKGDLHDIGKNLVGMMLRGAGFQVIDVGVDVAPEKFVESARASGAKVIGCSALLTTTMPQMKKIVETVRGSGLNVSVMIGGAPVTQGYCDEIGADGYAPDAASAADLAKQLQAVPVVAAVKKAAAPKAKAAPRKKVAKKVAKKVVKKVAKKAAKKVAKKVAKKAVKKVVKKAARKPARKVAKKAAKRPARKVVRKAARKPARRAGRRGHR